MDDDDDYYNIPLGCLECGTVFETVDLYEGRCPVCRSEKVVTFEQALAKAIEHTSYMQSIGLDEVDE